MKHCKRCGAELKDDAIYCYVCGSIYDNSLPDTDTAKQRESYRKQRLWEEKKLRQKRRGHLITFLILFVLVAAAFFTLMFSSALRVFDDIRKNRIEEAEILYRESVQSSLFESFLVRSFAGNAADRILGSYNNDRISYEDAYRQIQLLIEMEYPINAVEKRATSLDHLKLSKEAYGNGVKAEKDGDYALAMTYYSKVVSGDRNYNEAAKKAQSMAERYKESILDSVGSPTTEAEYETAIEVLTAAKKLLPNEQVFSDYLTTLRQNYSAMIKNVATEKAKTYIEKGYYKEAIELLKETLTYSSNDMQLQNLLTTATTNYEDFVKDQVKIYLDNRDWKGAMELLERVKRDLPDDAVIDQLYVTTKNSEGLYQ